MKNYVSLIMDIRKSREYLIEDRNEMQIYISFCIERLNLLFQDSMEYPVMFSAGDELQGLFLDATAAVMYFRLLEILLHPVEMRAGVGIGEWNVKILDGLSTHQDGPAYHRARRAIEDIYKKQMQNIKICSGTDDTMANHLLNASVLMKKQQIYKQNIVLSILELKYPFVKESVRLNHPEMIQHLLDGKFSYKMGKGKTVSMIAEEPAYYGCDIREEDVIMIDGAIKEAEGSIMKKSMAEAVSKILNCTRQNAASIIKSGNSNKIRELDYMALQYIERRYKEDI